MEEERYYDEYEIDLREYIKVLWAGKWLIIGLFIIALLVAGVYSYFILEPIYQAEAALKLSAIDGAYSDPATVIQVIKGNSFMAPIVEKYHKDYTPSQSMNYIKNNLEVSSVKGTKIIEIKLKDKEPAVAKEMLQEILNNFIAEANVYYEKFISTKQDYLVNVRRELKQIEQKIKETQSYIDNISTLDINPAEKSVILTGLGTKLDSYLNQRNSLWAQEENLKEKLFIYQPPKVINKPYLPENPISPNKKLNIAIAGVLALMLGVFIVFFREFMKEDERAIESKSL